MPASWLKWRQLNYRKPSDVWHKHAHAHSPQVMDDFQDKPPASKLMSPVETETLWLCRKV